MTPDYSGVDSALEELTRFGPESAQAGATHAPMVVETLSAMGHPEAITKWLPGYERRLDQRSGVPRTIAPDEWRHSLGHFKAYEAWIELFDRELSEVHWTKVIRRWVPRLSRGVAAAAFHGLLRTAHAVRALSYVETGSRRHELAEGLAYWSARYLPLPEARTKPGTLSPSRALETLTTIPSSNEKMALESMISGLLMAARFQPFGDAINASGSGTTARWVRLRRCESMRR
jgi:hypothetical protein